MSNIPNELERKAVIDAVLNLFGASKTESLMLPIPGTNPQLWIAAGELEEIRALTAMTNDNKQPDAVEWKPTHAEVVAWNERNGGWFQGRLDEARCAIDDARSMHLLSAAPTPPSAPVQQSVREAFEQYVKDNWFIGDPTREYELSKALSSYDGEYIDSSTRSAWKQWQAALSTSPLLDKNDQAEGDICARFTVWWNHNRGRFTTTRQAAYAAFMAEAQAAPQPDSNELVEAVKSYLAALDGWENTNKAEKRVERAEFVMRKALAQSPSVGLNTKKGG
jgi:hypothetical protein